MSQVLQTTIQSHTQQLVQKADLETVNEKIDAIPFVGRNLFLNSDFSSQESWAGLPTISKDGTINYIRSSSTFITSQKVDVIEGEEYVVSALVRAVTTTPTNFSIKFNVGNYNSTNIDITSTDWVRVSVTITAKSTIKEQIYLCNRGNAGIDIAFVKLEKGTKDTDWSLAPEDIQASIDAKANSSDVYVKTEVYTKAQTDSAIKLAKDEINLGVSSTYETKTNVETQINGVKSSVTNLESRVSKAEQKITDSAIISTVQNTINTAKTEAINSANSNTANQLKNYSTTSQMNSAINQKADSITSEVVKIENSMAIDNLLANGNFTNNLNNWQYSDYGSPVNYSLSANTDWTMIGKTALLLTQSWHPQGYDSGFTQEIEVKPNTDYTFTGYIASHRAEGLIIIKDEAGNWLTFDKTDADYDQYTGGANIANWKRIRVVYYSGNRTKLRLHLALGKSNDNGHVWFHDFMVTEGETDLCWKPSERETRTQISQLNDKIETKASIDNMWSYIQQNPYAVMTAINNGRGINGISIDENGLSVFRNNIISMMLNDGKTQLYNPYSGTYMGYFGTEDNDLRVQLTGASTFSVRGGYNDVRMLDLDFNHGHAYGNSTMRICGDVLFQHRDNPNATGVNGLGLGNDDRADMYGHHNIFLLCHNSFGIADNNGLTNGFYDARRGRWVIKGGLYQNTESPPSAYILSIDEEHPFFCGKTKMNIVDSILNLETTIKVDNEDDLTMMILPNDDDLVMTDIGNQKHIDQSSIIAGLVETVKSLNNRMLELESELNKRGR